MGLRPASDLRCLEEARRKERRAPRAFSECSSHPDTPPHSALALWFWRLGRAGFSLDPAPTRSPASAARLWLLQGSGGTAPGASEGGARGWAPAAPDWLPSGPAGGAPGWAPFSRSQTAGRRGRREPGSQWTRGPEQLQRAGARPPPRRRRWGEARLAEARRRPGRAGPQAGGRRDHGGGGRCFAPPAVPPRASGGGGDAGPGGDG